MTRLAGIGPAVAASLAVRGIETVLDLAWTLPTGADDLRAPLTVPEARGRAAEAGGTARVAIAVTVRSAHLLPIRGKRIVRVIGESSGETVHAMWYFAARGVLSAAAAGSAVLLVGRLELAPGKPPRMTHPDVLADSPERRVVLPRYDRALARESVVRTALAHLFECADVDAWDPIPRGVAEALGFRPFAGLLRAAHGGDATAAGGALERLAWVEIFARVRARLADEDTRAAGGHAIVPDEVVAHRVEASLGFTLTPSQSRTVKEIREDMARGAPMRRLLFGDVGTGKTAVALLAAAHAIAAGRQVAVLAPTSVLLDQYATAIEPLVEGAGARVALLSASTGGAKRERILEALRDGSVDLVVGTHALLSTAVGFARLGLVIVDEQHRLGVAQRLVLVQKGERPHLLTLSATPIPRTLALALRGEVATSTLDERPAARALAGTEVWPSERRAEAMALAKAACDRGERVFFVVPRVGDLDEDDGGDDEPPSLARAREAVARATAHAVSILHGGLRPVEQLLAMRRFRTGAAPILVCTTVVEVGVDVPEATLMIVDGAERFGLSQLHQLRGRVGRGRAHGRCLLLHASKLDGERLARLRALADLRDGEAVARHDLATRGMGELSGKRQSGQDLGFSYVDPLVPPSWTLEVEPVARRLREEDPALDSSPVLRRLVARLDHGRVAREDAG